jgi:predicted ester cyclase
MVNNTVTAKFVNDGFGYLNARNLDAFFALYSADLRNPSLANLGLPTSLEGFKAFLGSFYASFSEPKFLPQKIVCDGPATMFRWVFKGKHTGDFNGVKPTGKPVEVTCFTSFQRGEDGLIIEQHDGADLLTLMRQIGALP